MKRFNIAVKKTYNKNGEEKAFWPQVGTLVEFDPSQNNPDGGFALELNMFPGTKFYVFEQKPKEDGQKSYNSAPKTKEEEESRGGGVEYPEEEVNPEDIPF